MRASRQDRHSSKQPVEDHMRIVIMGAGGLGGYFGARLAAAGNDVAFIARGAHLAAIRRDGLRVTSAIGDLHLRDVQATDTAATLAPADVDRAGDTQPVSPD